jgi:hypothetical protein
MPIAEAGLGSPRNLEQCASLSPAPAPVKESTAAEEEDHDEDDEERVGDSYNRARSLGLTDTQQRDLVEYLKSL